MKNTKNQCCKSILLTGGLGYIGSHVVVALAERYDRIVIIDNLSNSSINVKANIEKIIKKPLKFYYGDVRSSKDLEKVFSENEISCVLHFAGLKSVSESNAQPIDYYDFNVVGLLNLVKAMKCHGVYKIIFSSSATVYGIPKYLPIDEEHPRNPISPYGRSKLISEFFLEDIAQSEPKWHVAILRYFNPVGSHESSLIGDKPVGTPNNLMPIISQVANGVMPKLMIYGSDYETSDGTGVRDYIHVLDLARGHCAALDYITSCNGFNVFNLGTGHGYTVKEVIEQYVLASGKEVLFEIKDRRKGDVAACYSDASKAKKMLNWAAEKGLLDMCRDQDRFENACK